MQSRPPPAENFSLATKVGRLVEARITSLKTRKDVEEYGDAFGTHLMRIPQGVRAILIADHRPVSIYAQEVADRLLEMFKPLNAHLERVAIITAPSNATFAMQLDRIVRAAGYAARKVVYAPEEAVQHLAPVLTPQELKRVRQFLDEYPKGTSVRP
ncbi:MAG: hypothetical protein ABW133_05970 [Polyangiaceae bacterium]